MESTGRLGEQRAEDGDDGENRPAWAFTAHTQSEFCRYARCVDGIRAFVDPDPETLPEFLARVGAVRRQLEGLVRKADEIGEQISTNDGFLGDLRSTYRQFARLQRSPLAWHDVHGGDADLMGRAQNLLLQASSQGPRQSRV